MLTDILTFVGGATLLILGGMLLVVIVTAITDYLDDASTGAQINHKNHILFQELRSRVEKLEFKQLLEDCKNARKTKSTR